MALCLSCGMPALAAPPAPSAIAAVPPLSAYGKLPALDLVRLSPSGDRLAFIAVDGEARKLFVRKVGGDALLVSAVGTSKVRDIEWAGEDYVLVMATVTQTVGNGHVDAWSYSTRIEPAYVLVVNLKTGNIAPIFDHARAQMYLGQAAQLGSRQIDGRWYDYVYSYDMDRGLFIYRIDLETGAFKVLPHFEGPNYDHVIGSDGAVLARSRYDETGRAYHLLAGDHGEAAITTRVSDLNQVTTYGLGRTPGTVVVEDETVRGADTIDEYRAVPGAKPARLFDGLDIEGFFHDPTTHLLIGGRLTRHRGAVFFDSRLQHRYDAAQRAFPGYQVTLVSAAADFARMVVKTDGGDDPGTYWLIDMATGKAQDLMAAYPTIDQKAVAPTRMFAYRARDGLPLEGVLTLPPGSSGLHLPLVVMPHGGPIGVYDQIEFNFWAQAFASRGYAVFQPNYRGSGGYGPAFKEAGWGQWGHAMLSDIADGVEALVNAGVADRARMCIVGASYGGYAALASVTIRHDPYRCVVAVSAVTDVGAIFRDEGDSPSDASGRANQLFFGASFAGAPSLREISPVRHAAEASAPILLVHGKDDTTVPYVHSLSMDGALEKAGKPVTLVTLDGEDHYWSHEKTRLQVLEASVAFVEKHNPAP